MIIYSNPDKTKSSFIGIGANMFGFYQSRNENFYCQQTINNCFPAHLHKQVEILYVKEGHLKSTIDGKETILKPGDISISFPNIVHNTETIDYSKAILLIFDSSFVSAFSNELLKFYPENPFIINDGISDYSHYFDLLLNAYNNHEDSRILMGFLYILLGKINENLQLISNKNADLQNTCHLLLKYINNHFTEDISLDTLSKSLNVSKYYISHIFSNKIKTSFPTYLNHCRIDYAKNLLLNSDDSVTEIGFNAGFNSSRTFYRIFKESCDMTPSEFRERNMNLLDLT